ncbi:phospholipase domain-containing protein [Streptomyces sp. NPDC051664]|uniref:phospholipase domain-containing protein n=1 Tax=Streptomyces sp. NPDC051664 TaxID=3365668 RepID=UPI00379446C0
MIAIPRPRDNIESTAPSSSVATLPQGLPRPGRGGRTAIRFRLCNASTAAVKFTTRSNNYRADGPWTYTVPAGGSTEDYFNAVAGQNGWYDFTVTADADSTWSRRYTGHIETGAASISG